MCSFLFQTSLFAWLSALQIPPKLLQYYYSFLMRYDVSDGLCDVQDAGCLRCRMLRLCDVWGVGHWDVRCLGRGTFGMGDVRGVRCLRCGMLGMWDVQDVGCSGCGMLTSSMFTFHKMQTTYKYSRKIYVFILPVSWPCWSYISWLSGKTVKPTLKFLFETLNFAQ